MDAPSPEKVAELKVKFPERSLHQVEIDVCGETHYLVMTGPSSDEHKKFTDEMLDAQDKEEKDRKDFVASSRGAILRAVLAQTRHPARDEVQRFFDFHPEALDTLPKKLREHAGANAEVRSKKL